MGRAIHAAAHAGIVIMFSTADEGARNVRTVAGSEAVKSEVLSISACGKYGKSLSQTPTSGTNYHFLGENVYAGPVHYSKSDVSPDSDLNGSLTGSSVATALASGTASLIIACCRIPHDFREEEQEFNWRKLIVQSRFDLMKAKDEKWVDLENFCGQHPSFTKSFDFEDFVNRKFNIG